MKDYSDSKDVEKAITFLVNQISQSGNNPKPVILHSIRVSLYLWDKEYPLQIVLSGMLHDLIEDSDTLVEDIKEIFGNEVSEIVEANSFNEEIQSRVGRYKSVFESCVSYGKDALIVKAADLLDNAPYYALENNLSFGRNKIAYFLPIIW